MSYARKYLFSTKTLSPSLQLHARTWINPAQHNYLTLRSLYSVLLDSSDRVQQASWLLCYHIKIDISCHIVNPSHYFLLFFPFIPSFLITFCPTKHSALFRHSFTLSIVAVIVRDIGVSPRATRTPYFHGNCRLDRYV